MINRVDRLKDNFQSTRSIRHSLELWQKKRAARPLPTNRPGLCRNFLVHPGKEIKGYANWRFHPGRAKSCLGNDCAPSSIRQKSSFHNVLGNHDRGPMCPPLFCSLPDTGETFRGPEAATRSLRTSHPYSGSWHLNARPWCGEPSARQIAGEVIGQAGCDPGHAVKHKGFLSLPVKRKTACARKRFTADKPLSINHNSEVR